MGAPFRLASERDGMPENPARKLDIIIYLGYAGCHARGRVRMAACQMAAKRTCMLHRLVRSGLLGKRAGVPRMSPGP